MIDPSACDLSAGDLYTYPTASDTVNATSPVTFKWNTACDVSSSTIDLYLYAPSSAAGLIHAWTNVDFSTGQYTATLQPKWWNSTETVSLQLNIIEGGGYSFMSSSPLGPVFTATYPTADMYATTVENGKTVTSTAAAAATQSADAVFQDVSNTSSHHGISKGGIAAAVVVPILFLIALAAVGVKFWRGKEKAKRRRWSTAMSTHSGLDWEKGAQPGEKPQSILGRPSMSTIARPHSLAASSTFAVENNMAGAGAGGFARPDLAGLRSASVDNVHQLQAPRQSRISFAEQTRPDRRSRLSFGGDLRPTVSNGSGSTPVFRMAAGSKSASELSTPRSKAYATGSALDDQEEEINISPSQMQGPHAFAEAEMRRVGQGRRTGRRSMLSIGDRSRRSSVVSAVDPEDFKSAASARGSVDELRDIEANILRRSVMSIQSNAHSPDPNQSETLEDVPPVPSPKEVDSSDNSGSKKTYGPDEMLAVYAARAKSQAAGPATVPTVTEKPQPVRQNSAMRLFPSLGGKKNADASLMPPPPTPQDMKSMVHLNNGTVSSSVVDAMPHPGPPSGGLAPQSAGGRTRSNTLRQSDASAYSDDVGRAA